MLALTNKLTGIMLFAAIALFSANSYAENAREFGPYVVHYNAFRSDTISPEIAKQYDLPRANNRILINISVLQKVMGTTGKPTASEVTGHANNLTGQLKNLEFKEIKEGAAIYYIAETKISDGEFLKFDIKIVPEGETRPARLSFSKRFFTY
jgi:ribosomal protein L1